MSNQRSTAGRWSPHCSECRNRCKTAHNDYGFDYEGPRGRESHDDDRWESDCCSADVIEHNPTCTRCDTYLRDNEPVFWTHGSLLCEDCHNGVPLDS